MAWFTRCLGVLAVSGLSGSALVAQEAAPAAAPAPAAAAAEAAAPVDAKDVADKLLPLTDMETAFKKAWATQQALARQVVDLDQHLKQATDDEVKKDIRKKLGESRKNLQTMSVAMEVIFGVGRARIYEYDEVKNTIFLRVGTAEEVFVRAIRARDAYGKVAAEQKAAFDKEEDAEKKKELEATAAEATRRYQIVAAALQQVYGVTPKRAYSYNPKNSTLYLKVSDNELENLKEQLAKLQEARKAGAKPADAAPAEKPAETAPAAKE